MSETQSTVSSGTSSGSGISDTRRSFSTQLAPAFADFDVKSEASVAKEKAKLSVVVFAGGRGASTLIEALSRHTQVQLTILVNAYDDGLSTGRMRKFIPGMLGPSDIRKNFANLLSDGGSNERALKRILEFRLGEPYAHSAAIRDLQRVVTHSSVLPPAVEPLAAAFGELKLRQARRGLAFLEAFLAHASHRAHEGISFDFGDAAVGNLLFAGAYLLSGESFNPAIERFRDFCETPGRVLNITDGRNLILIGLKEDGEVLHCEAEVVAKQSAARVADIFLLERELSSEELDLMRGKHTDQIRATLAARSVCPSINPDARATLENAGVIIYGPGTQHSSLFPSYLTQGVAEAIGGNRVAEKIYISNILKDHEIQSETANSLVRKLIFYMSRRGTHGIESKEIVTTFFMQRQGHSAGEDPNYVEFDPGQFEFPAESIVVEDWESAPGKHSGARVLDEVISIVNTRLATQVRRSRHRVSIVVPGLNEERTVRSVLHHLTLLDFQPLGIDKEVIFVDGGSIDETVAHASSIRGVTVLPWGGEAGRGAALRRGIAAATGDMVVTFPSDGEYAAECLLPLVDVLAKHEYKAVFGSRAVKCVDLSDRIRQIYKGDTLGYLTGKYGGILLSVGSLLAHNRYVTDPLSSVKGFDTRMLRSLKLESSGVDLEMEIVAKLAAAHEFILEIPVDYQPRTRDEGKKTSLVDGIKALCAVWKYR